VASRAARRSRRFTKGGPGIAGACEPAAFLLIAFLVFPAAASAAPNWTEADKDGYGTSTTTASKVWHTLDDGRLTEVFYPDLGTPSVRSLEFVVSQGAFSQRDSQAQNRSVQLIDSRSLTYRQVNEEPGRYRLTKTYVTDPARSVLMVDVRLESLTGKKLGLDLVYDPGLGNDYQDDVAEPDDDALLARDTGSPVASAVLGAPAFEDTSSQTTAGDLVQTAHTALTGLPGSQRLTVALGFGETTGAAQDAATASLGAGFGDVRGAYQSGWHDYIGSLKPAPKSADRTLYHASVMTLAAHEDKTYRGGYIASPTMPWVWGTGLENPSGAYHLVWSRDLYQIATALIAAGDTAGANRAIDYLFLKQQKPDGSFPQNSTVDGTPHWTNLQLDEVALPIVLAWQLGRTDSVLYTNHIKKAADSS
jgi:glucoamylase